MQRRAMGLLFTALALVLAAVGAAAFVGAHSARRWIVGIAAVALAAWLGSLALGVLRPRR